MNCQYLKEVYAVHTFSISKTNENIAKNGIKFRRIRQTDKNWNNYHELKPCSIEFYGKLIENL